MAEELAETFPEPVPVKDESEVPAPPPKKKFDRSIVEGPLSRAVWKIA